MERTYGFVAIPGRSVRNNVFTRLMQLPVAGFIYRASNTACHDLCVRLSPPKGYQHLLGLGLKFCVRPRMTCTPKAFSDMAARFRRNVYVKTYFADDPTKFAPDQLYLSSGWKPDDPEIPLEIRARISSFQTELRRLFVCKTSPPNLSPLQRSTLSFLRTDLTFIVFPADKNLGLCIIERDEYIRRVFKDHLLDTKTYQPMTADAATAHLKSVQSSVKKFLKDSRKLGGIDDEDRIYIDRSLDVPDPFSYFYGTAKIHKDPWKLRPIVSYSGCLLHGLGRWLDQQLQPFARELPTYLKSSFDLKLKLEEMEFPSHQTFSLFTCDARSMYTNIDTDHALAEIGNYLRQEEVDCYNPEAIMTALSLLMRNNVFRFGDTFWKQLTGTAMGAPPACAYAQLYFGIHELKIIPRFEANLPLYFRYIDDGFGIWLHDPDPAIDHAHWVSFQEEYSSFGILIWDFSDRKKQMNFLDLMITLENGTVSTRIYEKEMNLYQYIPPNSAHAPNVIKAFISGLILRIFRLTSRQDHIITSLRDLFERLLARGHPPDFLKPVFEKGIPIAAEKIKHRPSPEPDPDDYMAHFLAQQNQEPPEVDMDSTVFLHMTHHHHGPRPSDIQRAFNSTFLNPPGEQAFHQLTNTVTAVRGAKVNIRRLILAQHRVPNIKNLLFPRTLKQQAGREVSTILNEIQPEPPPPPAAHLRLTVNPYTS